MGILISALMDRLFPSTPCRIMMLGLDNAGKTTLLYKMKLGKVVTTIPTIGFNVETVEYKHISFTVWDVGGHEKLRKSLLPHYFEDTQGVIYIVDSTDPERLEEARTEMESMLEDDRLQDVSLLVFANKQDLPGAMTTCEVTDKMQLEKQNTRQWSIQATSAVTGEGIADGLEWMANTFNTNKRSVVS